MEKIQISSHCYLLGFELFYFNEAFNAKQVQKFLLDKCSYILVENVGQIFLRSLPDVDPCRVSIKIKKAYQNSKFWFVVFELNRPMYKNYRGNVDNTFVYMQGDTKIISIAEQGHGVEAELEGEMIYSAEE